MPPPPPHLMDELVEECFLHLPLDDPASLVRAALVCKRWRRILADRGFRRRFGKLHHGRRPPMLGFLHVSKTTGGACFTPTSSFRPRNADDLRGRRAIDARHGRVLLAMPLRANRPHARRNAWPLLASMPLLSNLTVWVPITGEQVDLPGLLPSPQHPGQLSFFNSRAAVLCAAAAAACNHVDCHRDHFVVVLMHTTYHKVCVHVYSSQAGAWSQTTSVAQDLGNPRMFFHLDACALAGNTLYFTVYMKTSIGILKYDLGAQEIGFVNLPPDCADRRCRILLTTREDGGLGFAQVKKSRLHLWSMDGVLVWTPTRVIELQTLLPVRANNNTRIYMVSFVHGLGAFFVRVNAGAFTVDLVSCRVRKVADNRGAKCFVPYTSFCIPAFKDGSNQVYGVSSVSSLEGICGGAVEERSCC